MNKPSFALAASLALAAALAGCTPSALQAAVQAGMAANGGASAAPGTAASTAPGASAAPASTAPTTKPSAAASASAAVDADIAALAGAFMDAVDAAAEQDPELVMRLFVTGLATYDTDPALGRAMMGYAMSSRASTTSASSPTGYEPQNADSIYFRTIERDTKIGRYFLDTLASGDLPFTEMAAKVVIDAEYKAIDKGLSADGKLWTYYLKVNHPNNVRARPVRLQKDGERGWRVSNYSSLMVLP